jgi:ribosomal protein L34E
VQINQIMYFIALYEERYFTRAAKRCRISQPSLTIRHKFQKKCEKSAICTTMAIQ